MAKKQDARTEVREKVYKRIDLVGTSSESFEAAIANAVRRAGETVTDLRWFEVKEMRGSIQNQQVSQYQVVVSVAFEVR
jgi:flavin-binding protein dodecin